MTHSHPRLAHQRGVAVVTALLLTTLAVTIVASLFWQQQVQVRSIENQRTQLQKQWILRGALDWARLILRSDVNNVDYLGDPWAIPLAEVRLDEFVENGKQDDEASSAVLSGYIIDAQSRFNLNTLARGGVVNPKEVAAFARLLASVRIASAEALASAMASYISATQPLVAAGYPGGATNQAPGGSTVATPSPDPAPTPSAASTSTTRLMPLMDVGDVLAVEGFTPDILAKLKDFITVIPGEGSAVNVNTTSPEVLSAVIPGLSLSDAQAMVAGRERAYFKDIADFNSRLPAALSTSGRAGSAALDVKTQHFLVNGKVRLNNAILESQSLVFRPDLRSPVKVIWTREN